MNKALLTFLLVIPLCISQANMVDYNQTGSEQYGSEVYLNQYKSVYDLNQEEAYEINPDLFKFWSGYVSPAAHHHMLCRRYHHCGKFEKRELGLERE